MREEAAEVAERDPVAEGRAEARELAGELEQGWPDAAASASGARRQGPMITTTPTMPSAMPASCRRPSLSTRKASVARSAVMIGVVAL